MSNKELIRHLERWAEDDFMLQRSAVLKEAARVLQQHEPKPGIRKGEVYYCSQPGFTQFTKACEPREISETLRQLTIDEMPEWVEDMVREHGVDHE